MNRKTYSTLEQLFEERQNELGISDRQIAVTLGYSNPRIISMIKAGQMTLPMVHVIVLSALLKVPDRELTRLLLLKTNPEAAATIEKVFGATPPRKSRGE